MNMKVFFLFLFMYLLHKGNTYQLRKGSFPHVLFSLHPNTGCQNKTKQNTTHMYVYMCIYVCIHIDMYIYRYVHIYLSSIYLSSGKIG